MTFGDDELIVGQCDLDQRSLLCINVGLGAGPINLHFVHPREARQASKLMGSLRKAARIHGPTLLMCFRMRHYTGQSQAAVRFPYG